MSFHIQHLKHNFTEIDIPLDNNISGIYLLKNNYNQETYIGASTDIKHRVYRHFSVFFKENNSNIAYQINRFPKRVWSCHVLEKNIEYNSLKLKESQYIIRFNPSINERLPEQPIIYPLDLFSESYTLNFKFNMRKNHVPVHTVDTLDRNTIIHEFYSIDDAAQYYNISRRSILRSINRRHYVKKLKKIQIKKKRDVAYNFVIQKV